jgi:hypothetical protein
MGWVSILLSQENLADCHPGGQPLPWTSARILSFIIVGGVTLIVFVLWGESSHEPAISLNLMSFRDLLQHSQSAGPDAVFQRCERLRLPHHHWFCRRYSVHLPEHHLAIA